MSKMSRQNHLEAGRDVLVPGVRAMGSHQSVVVSSLGATPAMPESTPQLFEQSTQAVLSHGAVSLGPSVSVALTDGPLRGCREGSTSDSDQGSFESCRRCESRNRRRRGAGGRWLRRLLGPADERSGQDIASASSGG